MRLFFVLTLMLINLSANEVYATFEVQAEKSANLAFSSGGIVKEVLVDVSSKVKKNQIIATLNNKDIKARLEASKTTLKFAKLDYDRQVKVKKIIDKEKFDQYAYKYESAKIEASYQDALFNKTLLRAPFDGIIFEKLVEVGDVVSGQAIRTILKIQNNNSRKLILEFDQKYHKEVNVGDSFEYKIDGDKKTYTGVISKIYPYSNSNTRKIKAEVLTTDVLVGLFGDGLINTLNKQ